MKRLRLNLETLAVDSFDVGDPRAVAGTVRGHDVLVLQTSSPSPCPTAVSRCARCFYTMDPCECTDIC